jgi:imidazolonepropionase-like amidohydrolase
MVRYGMRPVDALRSATVTSATLLGLSSVAGTIEPGKSADLIAFKGNPLEDIRVVQHVSFVMKEGIIYVNR